MASMFMDVYIVHEAATQSVDAQMYFFVSVYK